MSSETYQEVLCELNQALRTKFTGFSILRDGLRAAIEDAEYKEDGLMTQILDSYLRAFSSRLCSVLTSDCPELMPEFLSLSLSPTIRIEHAPTLAEHNLYTRAHVDFSVAPCQLVLQIDASRFWSNIGDTAENLPSMLRTLKKPAAASAASSSAVDSVVSSSSSTTTAVSDALPSKLQPIVREVLVSIDQLYPGLLTDIELNYSEFDALVTEYREQIEQILTEYLRYFGENFCSFLKNHIESEKRRQELEVAFREHGLQSKTLLVCPAAGPGEGHYRVLHTAFKRVAGLAIVSGQMVLFINPTRFWQNVHDTAAVRDTDFYFFPLEHLPKAQCYCHSGREKQRYVKQSTLGMASYGGIEDRASASSSAPAAKCWKCAGTGWQACFAHGSPSSGCGQCKAGKKAKCSTCGGTGKK